MYSLNIKISDIENKNALSGTNITTNDWVDIKNYWINMGLYHIDDIEHLYDDFRNKGGYYLFLAIAGLQYDINGFYTKNVTD